jgi:hypothetical protein
MAAINTLFFMQEVSAPTHKPPTMYENNLPKIDSTTLIIPREEEELHESVCIISTCRCPVGSPLLTFPCGHMIHNSCLYKLALHNKGDAMPCPECNDVQLATMCSVLASTKDTCTSKNSTTSHAYVMATSVQCPGTDLHHIQKAASITVLAAYGSWLVALLMMPDYLTCGSYGGKLTGLLASHQLVFMQCSLESAYEHNSMPLGAVHMQCLYEFSVASASFLGGRAKCTGGTCLNGSQAF